MEIPEEVHRPGLVDGSINSAKDEIVRKGGVVIDKLCRERANRLGRVILGRCGDGGGDEGACEQDCAEPLLEHFQRSKVVEEEVGVEVVAMLELDCWRKQKLTPRIYTIPS